MGVRGAKISVPGIQVGVKMYQRYRANLESFLGNSRIASIRTTGAFAFPIVNVPAPRTTLRFIEIRNHINMVKRASQRS